MAHRRKGNVKCVARMNTAKSESGSGTTPGMGTLTTHTYVKNRKGQPTALQGDELKRLKAFVKACERAGIPPTRRQLSRWNLKKGIAYTPTH